ncbi:MAG: GNAT family N-acetyltransferase [Clostridia bacterium]|nr:GNAT family N-acetyltransferase [Clostridia bacterium]MBQ5813199.1 GNAT family N-acetyltransferase [Clostridia bacterium]
MIEKIDSGAIDIKRIDRENYSMFADMLYWRATGNERGRSLETAPDELSNPNLYVYAAQQDGRFVGWISLIYLPKVSRVKKGYIYVDELWVQQNHRRQGIARRLMDEADRLKEELGATGVRLYVNTQSDGAKKLYSSCGFGENGTALFMEK